MLGGMPDLVIVAGQDSNGAPRELLTETDGTVHAMLGAGTAKIGKVTDQLCTLAGVGQKTTGASAAVTTGVTGGGYLTILNTDASAAAYLGTGTVDNTKFLLPAGASVTWPVSDVTTINCYGSGAVLSWAFLQVA